MVKKATKKAAKKATKKVAKTAKKATKKVAKTTKKAAKKVAKTTKKATKKVAKATKKATKKVAKKAAPKKATKKVAKATKKVAKKKSTRKPNPAFMKPLTPSKELAAIVGTTPLPRTEVVKKIWAYIKRNNLQDAKNKRNINADDKLKAVFNGKKSVSMFEMTKLVSTHLK